MYVDSSSITVNHKTYTRHLLRTSFRKDGKVKHRTIANISSCSDEEIQAVKLGLKYKGNLAELASLDKSMKLQQGLRVGAVWVLLCLAKQLHIVDALGAGRQAVIFQNHDPTFFINMPPGSKAYPIINTTTSSDL